MRFHVLGVGSIGTLISYHLRRSLRLRQEQTAGNASSRVPRYDLHPGIPSEITAGLPPRPKDVSLTLHVRRDFIAHFFRGLSIEHAGIRFNENRFRLEAASTGQVLSAKTQFGADKSKSRSSSLSPSNGRSATGEPSVPLGPSVVERAGFTSKKDAIDSLIVTTKADATVEAIAPLCSRLTPASTIVLLQNGMGIVDELIEKVFPDARLRPQIILGNLTHGCYSKSQFETIHAGYGSIRLGVLADPRGRAVYERRQKFGSPRSPTLKSQTPPPEIRATSASNLSGLDFDAIPLQKAYLTLRYTLATLLSLPLDVHWDSLASYQVGALRKLVVNSCINPLTAILDCSNGQLLGDPYAQQIWSEVCHEAAEVLLAAAQAPPSGESISSPSSSTGLSRRSPEYTPTAPRRAVRPSVSPWSQVIHRPLPSSGDEPSSHAAPLLDPSLTPASLWSAVHEVAVLSRNNYSSMHSDVRGSPVPSSRGGVPGREWREPRGKTEIEYMNGYLVQLGQALGVKTQTNEMLRALVLSLCWGDKNILWKHRKAQEMRRDRSAG